MRLPAQRTQKRGRQQQATRQCKNKVLRVTPDLRQHGSVACVHSRRGMVDATKERSVQKRKSQKEEGRGKKVKRIYTAREKLTTHGAVAFGKHNDLLEYVMGVGAVMNMVEKELEGKKCLLHTWARLIPSRQSNLRTAVHPNIYSAYAPPA